MNVRTVLAALRAAIAVLLLACAQGRAPPAARIAASTQPPNVLVIILDDVGYTERALMPSLTALAAVGTEFTRAYAWPVCSTTRDAMFLGKYPRRLGIGGLDQDAHQSTQATLPLDEFSMAELFAPTHSTMLIGKWHMGRSPLDTAEDLGLTSANLTRVQAPTAWHLQGFEHGRAVNPSVPNAGVGASGFYDWWRCDAGMMTAETEYAVDVERDEFLAWWTATSGPKMAWLSWSGAHNSGPSIYETPPGGTTQPTVRAAYEQVLAYQDAQLATVLASVDLQTTFVVVVSDNGTPEDAHVIGAPDGVWKFTTYEGGVRVPLLVAGPGVSAGAVSSRVVSLVDIPATCAELAGVPIPAGFDDSMSFADALGNWTGTPARAFAWTEVYQDTANNGVITYDDQAVIEKQTTYGTVQLRMKLRRVDPDGAGPLPSADYSYDLLSDPYEMSPANPNTLPASIRNRLYAELASVPGRAP